MLATTPPEEGNPGVVFLGSFGVITIAIIGIAGCIPTKKNNTNNTDGASTPETEEQTSKGVRACRAFANWITNLYNVACFANPQWPCWKTLLMKALIMFFTTLGSALASLAITRLLADDDEDFEETVTKVVNYVLGEDDNRNKRDIAHTEGKLTTNEMTAAITGIVICTAWTIASLTVLVTYLTKQKNETARQIELGEQHGQGGEGQDLEDNTMDMDVNMELDVNNDKGLEITFNSDNGRGTGGYSEWITVWVEMMTGQIRWAVMYIRGTIMGQE